jgi:hypothetical protein
MKGFITILAVLSALSLYAQAQSSAHLEEMPPDVLPLGWVYDGYLHCRLPANTLCVVADPSGTPLNIRSLPKGPHVVGKIRNGVNVVVIDTASGSYVDWVYIGLNLDLCNNSHPILNDSGVLLCE